jgi:hypothetical protein
LTVLKKLVRVAVLFVTLPVDVAADVLTLGGVCVGKPEPYIAAKAKEIAKAVSE